MGLRQGRSLFGAFIRSPFGARGLTANDLTLESDGVATTSMVLRPVNSTNTVIVGVPLISRRRDTPYLTLATQFANTNAGGSITQHYGKIVVGNSTTIERTRLGLPFALPTMTNCIGASLQIGFITAGWKNTLETFIPKIYVPNVAVTTTTWRDHPDIYAGAGVYNVNSQTIDLNVAALVQSQLTNVNVWLIVGNGFELTGSGAASSGVANDASQFSWDGTVTLTLAFS